MKPPLCEFSPSAGCSTDSGHHCQHDSGGCHLRLGTLARHSAPLGRQG
uniref:Uncharacterized protein n=1 Tax=Arundo donax TaxID=35708 RepID=A0A0A9F1J9_ARUDO